MKSMKRYLAIAAMALVSISASAGTKETSKDIVDTAVSAGSFTTLAKALQAADLVETLKGAGPFTVFAPTDEAFAKFSQTSLEQLLKPENKDKLRAVLTYHVAPGRLAAQDVVKLNSLTTVNGQDLRIMAGQSGVKVNNANVTKTDIATSNGIIHVIDQVVIPDLADKAHVSKVRDLLARFESNAADMRRDAATLESKRRNKLDWNSHADMLTTMKEHVNGMGRMLAELESMKPQASVLQQKAIESARPHLEEMAKNVTTAIQMVNEDRRNVAKTEYLDTLHSIWGNADTLYKSVDAITDYKEAQLRLNSVLGSR